MALFNNLKCLNGLKINVQIISHKYFNTSHSLNAKDGPIALAEARIFSGQMEADPRQKVVIEKLQQVYDRTKGYTPKVSGFARKMFYVGPPKGLYIYGSVGSGKTMLMDLFYDSLKTKYKLRAHFNEFMADVHRRIHKAKSGRQAPQAGKKSSPWDPIKPVAKDLSSQAWCLCFDEFQVTDIGDAMILKQLFTELFDKGIVMVTTSNRPPDDLYKNGIQRGNFLPFIDVLKKHCDMATLTGQDYRRRGSGGGGGGGGSKYFVAGEVNANAEMNKAYKMLCAGEGDKSSGSFTILGRKISFKKTCGKVLDATFHELCDRPLGSADYLQIAAKFHTVLIRNVPKMNLDTRNQARRFITLIDTLYDRRVKLVMSAAAKPNQLFSASGGYSTERHTRTTMDDLQLKDSSSSLLSGSEELFAFDRTVSRITEMCSTEYWKKNK